jgi:hypothetical protein
MLAVVKRVRMAPLLLALGLGGCGTAPTVRGDWETGAARPPAFAKVLVVGVSPDYNQRCAFEQALVSSLRSGAVAATSACDYLRSREPLTRAAVEGVVAETRPEAVIATLLVDTRVAGKEGGTRDTRGGGYYKPVGYGFATGYYGVYGVPVVVAEFETADTVTKVQGAVTLATNVYDARDATAVYGATTRARRLESRGQALAVIAPAIADHLRRAGVVR